MTYRNRVIVAPTGNYGSIAEVIMRKAGNQKVSDMDPRNLVEFWSQIYDIDISPEEISVYPDSTFSHKMLLNKLDKDSRATQLFNTDLCYIQQYLFTKLKTEPISKVEVDSS